MGHTGKRAAWSDAMRARMERLWLDGRTSYVIAERLCKEFGEPVTRNAVLGRVHRAGLCRRPGRQAARPAAPSSAPTPRPAPPPRDCQWLIGDPFEPGFRMCGAPAVPGKPYCEKHCAIAYRRQNDQAAGSEHRDDGEKQ